MKYIPVSSANSCGQIHYGVPVIYDARQYVTRVDWMMNQKNQLYGRYLQDNYDQPAPFSTTNYLYTTTLGVNQRPQTFVLGETYAINPSTLNSFHFTFGRKFVARFPNTKGIDPADLGSLADLLLRRWPQTTCSSPSATASRPAAAAFQSGALTPSRKPTTSTLLAASTRLPSAARSFAPRTTRMTSTTIPAHSALPGCTATIRCSIS